MENIQKFVNYMVPATGHTRGYIVSQEFSADAKAVNFFNVELDGVPFRPSGVFVDNTQGTDDLVILINEMAYRIVVPAGATLQTQFPAPMSMSVSIIGEGQATCIFVDFPVIPFFPQQSTGGGGGGGGGAVTIADGADETLGSVSDILEINSNNDATVVSLLKGILYQQQAARGLDDTFTPLPEGFDSFATTMTYNGSDQLETEVRTFFGSTYTRTYTYTGTNLTAISAWVVS